MPKRVEILALRREVAREIVRSLGPNSAYVIAPAFGISQPRMSELERGEVGRCSLEWLVERVYRLGGSVTVTVELGDAGRAWSLARGRAASSARVVSRAFIPNLE